jgi:hypothetical protein
MDRRGTVDRKTLADRFLAPGNPAWKTFVLEAHASGEPLTFLADVFGSRNVRETDDVNLHEMWSGEASYIVDTIDPRFWSFHTSATGKQARPPIGAAVSRRHDLDFVWLPSAHLRAVQQTGQIRWVKTEFRAQEFLSDDNVQDLSFSARGKPAQSLLDMIGSLPEYTYALCLNQIGILAQDDLLGVVEEAVTRKATFLARGESFALHQQVIAATIDRYRGLIETAEQFALAFEPLGDHENHVEGGGHLTGGPIELTFSRRLSDFPGFIDRLLSSRAPFRLWGVVDDYGDEYVEVDAVDLHVGSRVRLEISPNALRLHLLRGGCGNTVARLISNLQRHVDGRIAAADPAIQAHLALTPSPAIA